MACLILGSLFTGLAAGDEGVGPENPTWPDARWFSRAAYDSHADRTIIFGGDHGKNDTWAFAFRSNSWEQLDRNHTGPSARQGHTMVFDRSVNRTILYGGALDQPLDPENTNWGLNETWAFDYDNDTWIRLSVHKTSPPCRLFQAMAYDSESDRTILFSGVPQQRPHDEPVACGTWAYDYGNDTWTEMFPSTSPHGRASGSMVYDSESDVMILFGGFGFGVGDLNDTWAYDYNSNSWENIVSNVGPARREIAQMIYDGRQDRAILFGGCEVALDGSAVNLSRDDLWAFDYNSGSWAQLAPVGEAPAAAMPALAYDSRSDKYVVFGGADATAGHKYSWEYFRRVDSDATWAFDSTDVKWTPLRRPDAPTIGTPILRADAFSLTWYNGSQTLGVNVSGFNLYRSEEGGNLSRLKSAIVSPEYEDSSVRCGANYSYAVAAVNAAGEGPASPLTSAARYECPAPPQVAVVNLNLMALVAALGAAFVGALFVLRRWRPPPSA